MKIIRSGPGPVCVGRGLLGDASVWKRLGARRAALVSERGAYKLFGRKTERGLRGAGIEVSTILLPAGEAAKSLRQVERLCSAMSRAGLGRDAAVVALGGGAVGDAAGFAAAVFLRGVRWASVPTTLLGQVDSGLGGKVGANLPEGKNLLGAFHQPALVVCDAACLDTLPARERISGIGEMLKYGLVFSPAFFRHMRLRWPEFMKLDPKALVPAIARCAAWKLSVVAKDERDESGLRETLNFGHTFGHALEKLASYGAFRHGEAVVWGMRTALALSALKGRLPARQAEEADRFLRAIPVPPLPRLSAGALWTSVLRDKKARGGKARFVLLKGLGRPVADATVTPAELGQALQRING